VFTRRHDARARTRRWVLKKLDEEALMSSILAAVWERETKGEGEFDLEGEVQWIRGVMEDACDASMPRVRPSPERSTY